MRKRAPRHAQLLPAVAENVECTAIDADAFGDAFGDADAYMADGVLTDWG